MVRSSASTPPKSGTITAAPGWKGWALPFPSTLPRMWWTSSLRPAISQAAHLLAWRPWCWTYRTGCTSICLTACISPAWMKAPTPGLLASGPETCSSASTGRASPLRRAGRCPQQFLRWGLSQRDHLPVRPAVDGRHCPAGGDTVEPGLILKQTESIFQSLLQKRCRPPLQQAFWPTPPPPSGPPGGIQPVFSGKMEIFIAEMAKLYYNGQKSTWTFSHAASHNFGWRSKKRSCCF